MRITYIVTIIISVQSLTLFFYPERYEKTDLLLAAEAARAGDYDSLLFAVRPLLIFLSSLFPSYVSTGVILSFSSALCYITTIYLVSRTTLLLYGSEAASMAAFLVASNYAVILNAAAPNADLPGLMSSVLLQYLIVNKIVKDRQLSDRYMISLGLLSGVLSLARENVLATVLSITLLLSLFDKRRLFIYLCGSVPIPLLWQIYATLTLNDNYLSWILSGGFALSFKYEGVPYNPIKVIGYLLEGLTPYITLFGLLGFLLDNDNRRLKLVIVLAFPSLLLSAVWPSLFEPRVAIIALPGLIYIAGHGANLFVELLRKKPIIGLGNGLPVTVAILVLYVVFNFYLTYINNGSQLSPVWSLLDGN
ncbi:MAG: glycosyltransferase family 39 protein [Aigarchaeota archaeon]|nr:glycosyltransferase family 39 protein [Aigarchaeota archaeon]MDW8093037.1 glycosyltransferase family 39 protein [Nitrososphaerota archaeon]